MDAHALGDLGVIDIRIFELRADTCLRYAAVVARGHALHMHHFLMIGAIVVHHAQQGNAMMGGGPEHAGRVHEIAVILDGDA
jgi:hypothetical protein